MEKQISIRVDNKTIEQLEKISAAQGKRSLGSIIREVLAKALAEAENKIEADAA